MIKTLLCILLSVQVFADETPAEEKVIASSVEAKEKAVFLGHLLTPTTYVPRKRTVTVGSHITSYSFTDNFLAGTSSFLYLFYNSPNIFLKYGKKYNEKNRWAIQFDYLKSSSTDPLRSKPRYKMEVFMLWGIWSHDVSEHYTIHYNLNYMYFLNEGKPHSLRREPFNDQPFQFALTSLHEVKISKHYGIATEVGILGVNYAVPNLHGALTFRYVTKNYLIQAGISFDRHLWGQSKGLEYSDNNPVLDNTHTREVITHPEVGFQYFF